MPADAGVVGEEADEVEDGDVVEGLVEVKELTDGTNIVSPNHEVYVEVGKTVWLVVKPFGPTKYSVE